MSFLFRTNSIRCKNCRPLFKPFPTCRHILTQQQQTTFENMVAKGEIAHDEQFLLWPQCFQLYLTIQLFFMEIFRFLSLGFQSHLLQICCMWNRVKACLTLFHKQQICSRQFRNLLAKNKEVLYNEFKFIDKNESIVAKGRNFSS